jgi:hypothetical protein
MIKFLNLIILLFVLILSIKVETEAVNYKLTAIHYGNQGWDMDQVGNLSLWLGKHPTTVVLYTDWCNTSMNSLFYTQLKHIWDSQSIPSITWGLYECNGLSQPGIIKLVNNNTFDAYLNQFSDRLKKWLAGNDGIYGTDDDRRAYIRLAHEMNGNWYPWSLGSTPSDYILAWRHVYNIFSNKKLDSTRLQWVWCVNNDDLGNYTAEDYWVGDNYVDWLGIDGYNFGIYRGHPWAWPNQTFDNMIGRLHKISSTKPIAINEYGSSCIRTRNTPSIQSKIEWLNQFCDYVNNNNQIKMASYFNKDKETDWAIFGGMYGDAIWNKLNVYTAYRNCLQSDEWIQSNKTNERIITDEQFAGRF